MCPVKTVTKKIWTFNLQTTSDSVDQLSWKKNSVSCYSSLYSNGNDGCDSVVATASSNKF